MITEKSRMEFRAEFFNLLNNVNFDVPNRTAFTSNFGRIFSAGPSRQTQLARYWHGEPLPESRGQWDRYDWMESDCPKSPSIPQRSLSTSSCWTALRSPTSTSIIWSSIGLLNAVCPLIEKNTETTIEDCFGIRRPHDTETWSKSQVARDVPLAAGAAIKKFRARIDPSGQEWQ